MPEINPGNTVSVSLSSGTQVQTEPAKISGAGKTYVCKTFRQTSPTASTDIDAYTVTTGKKLYVTTLIVKQTAAPARAAVGDDTAAVPASGSSASNIVAFTLPADGSFIAVFPVPMVFDVSVTFQTSNNTGDIEVSFVGWEEAE